MIAVSPMHLSKGLEFRAVAVMACDDEILPQQQRIETVADDTELESVTTPSGICSTSPEPEPATI